MAQPQIYTQPDTGRKYIKINQPDGTTTIRYLSDPHQVDEKQSTVHYPFGYEGSGVYWKINPERHEVSEVESPWAPELVVTAPARHELEELPKSYIEAKPNYVTLNGTFASEDPDIVKQQDNYATQAINQRAIDAAVRKGWGNKQWGKLWGGMMGTGVGIGALATAPIWAPAAGHWLLNTGLPFFARHIAAPTAAGMIVDEAQRAITGTTLTEQLSNYLQKERGWNPALADFTSGFTNPGYWINFGGGRYTAPLFNKIGLGFKEIPLSESAQRAIKSIMDNAEPDTKVEKFLQDKITQPISNFIDRNMNKFQAMISPYLLLETPTTINKNTMNKFEFVDNLAKLGEPLEDKTISRYLTFKSNANNEKVFGDAMRLKVPDINMTYYSSPQQQAIAGMDYTITPVLAGVSAVDIATTKDSDRNPAMRTFEYLTLGRYGARRFLDNRISSVVGKANDYSRVFYNIDKGLQKFFNQTSLKYPSLFRFNSNYTQSYDYASGLHFYRPAQNMFAPADKPPFNYKKASFDDLIKFVNKYQGFGTGYGNNLEAEATKDAIFSKSGELLAVRDENNGIKVINDFSLRNYLSKNIDIFDYKTGKRFTGQISVGDDGTINIPQEYTDILKGNIDYVQNTLFPGSGIKVYGSSAGVTGAGFPHATHDVDFYITQKELDKLIKKGVLSEGDKVNPGTYRYKLKQFGDKGDIDLNVLEQTPDGMATGIRAEELYKQYFPDEYFQALREFKARSENGDTSASIQISKTPEELLEAIDPSSKTIADSFDIDFTKQGKGKHKLRSWEHLVYSDPAEVAKGLYQYAQSVLGSRVKLFPISVEQLGDKELNLQALQKLRINLDQNSLDRIASDPQRMKNVLDAWYLMDNTAMRYINGTWPGVKGFTADNYLKSATTWIPENNGGNWNGAGLNTTIRGDSGYSGQAKIKAYISPNTEYKSNNLLDLIDEINYNFGKHPDAPSILQSIPKYGKEAVKQLQEVYDTKGWNFLSTLASYTGNGQDLYASATRTFNPNYDYVGFAPGRYMLHPLVPRLTRTEANPIISSGTLFTDRRYSSFFDFHRSKFINPAFTLNSFRGAPEFSQFNPFCDNQIDRLQRGLFWSIPGVATAGGMLLNISKSVQSSKVKKWLEEPDEVIKKMKEEDRRAFTPEGVDSLRQQAQFLGYPPEDADEYVNNILEYLYEVKYSK